MLISHSHMYLLIKQRRIGINPAQMPTTINPHFTCTNDISVLDFFFATKNTHWFQMMKVAEVLLCTKSVLFTNERDPQNVCRNKTYKSSTLTTVFICISSLLGTDKPAQSKQVSNQSIFTALMYTPKKQDKITWVKTWLQKIQKIRWILQ